MNLALLIVSNSMVALKLFCFLVGGFFQGMTFFARMTCTESLLILIFKIFDKNLVILSNTYLSEL